MEEDSSDIRERDAPSSNLSKSPLLEPFDHDDEEITTVRHRIWTSPSDNWRSIYSIDSMLRKYEVHSNDSEELEDDGEKGTNKR